MAPPLLSLRTTPAPTAGWATLTDSRASKLNEDDNVEPITFDKYTNSAEYEAAGGRYFEVRRQVMQQADHTYEYDVYDSRALWDGLQIADGKLPVSQVPIWREDYDLLHNAYAPNAPVASWATNLPSVRGGRRFYDANGAYIRLEVPPEMMASPVSVAWFEGPRGQERMAKVLFRDGRVVTYEGPRNMERMVSVVHVNGAVSAYLGEKGQERLVSYKITRANGIAATAYFDGPKGNERKVRSESSNGEVVFMQGERSQETAVRKLYPDGRMDHLYATGPSEAHSTYLSRSLEADGTVTYYRQGAVRIRDARDAAQERTDAIVRQVGPDGTILK